MRSWRRIFDLKTPKGISKVPHFNFYKDNKHSLDSNIRVIKFLLQKISTNRKEELECTIKNLFESHKENPDIKRIIEVKIVYFFS